MKSKFFISTALILVLEGKGGTGKSLIAQVLAAMLRAQQSHNDLALIDTDSTNSSTRSIEGNAIYADLSESHVRGKFANAIKDLRDKRYSNIIVDTGARDEARIIDMLKWICETLRAFGGRVIVVRPITLSSHVQTNAVAFALDSAKTLNIPTIFVRNLGQGRDPEQFKHWHNTSSREAALSAGVVECTLADAGAQYADEASGVDLSLADVAIGNFEKAGKYAVAAEGTFDEDQRAWLALWLHEQIEEFQRAFAQVLAAK